jgi:predicted RNase H-like HicB family nuclease
MVIYKAMYKFLDDGWVHGEVLDFPGVITCDEGLNQTRVALASALTEMAELLASDGEPLPQPDSSITRADADIEEPIYQSSH